MTQVRVLIVDDEPLARERVRTLLSSVSDMVVVGESENGQQAVEDIHRYKPDLVFLDVQMPEVDGFQALQQISTKDVPEVIFVTAYDTHAVRAFEVHALDYLLKPFDTERFLQALDRARRHVALRRGGRGDMGRALLDAIKKLRPNSGFARRLSIKNQGVVSFVPVEEIDWIEAAGNYVRLHTDQKTLQMRESLSHLADRLDPEQFARIHRSIVVNLSRIREVQPMFHGDAVAVLHNGSELPVSRNFRSNLAD